MLPSLAFLNFPGYRVGAVEQPPLALYFVGSQFGR